MSDRVAILRIERKALAELGEHAEFLREHPGDDSPEMAALDGSLDHDYFAPLVWNERNGKLVDGVNRRSVATELDPKYCAVILERMTSHGLTPKLLGNHAPL